MKETEKERWDMEVWFMEHYWHRVSAVEE
jgi:hypothetical protein